MSHHLDLSGCKKRKRGERVFKFKTFGEKGYPSEFDGSFEENVRALLDFGQAESGARANWSFQLEVGRHPLLHVFLFVVEEPVELSLELHCKHCQYIGWGNHMICNKNYHFVLPMSKLANVIELQGQTHSMHAVFHSNGFGHLLYINGSENGSELSGHQIMDFWDRLCSGLGARQVSLKDTANKKGMDLRLLHAVAYGKTWFGRWDYVFGRGSYGVTREMYQSAIKAIQNIPLTTLLNGSKANEIQIVLSRYQVLSGHSLVTMGDMFYFMLELKSQLPKQSKSNMDLKQHSGIMSDASCRWSPKRVGMAIHVVVEALKKADFRWVPRQHVRDVARAYIGDTGLLDFVLKSLGNHIVGKYFVRRCLNPVTKVLEYCLEDVSNALPMQLEGFPSVEPKLQKMITWGQLMEDLLYMERNILRERQLDLASRVILDSKHLVKEYHCDEILVANKRRIYCRVMMRDQEKVVTSPYHGFKLKSNTTFSELKSEVETKFREIYLGLRDFSVKLITNINPKESDLVFETVKPGGKIDFEGDYNMNEGLIVLMMSNSNSCVVECVCGVKEDDGERMVCCDVCELWQHSRCVGVADTEQIPNIFLCSSCDQGLLCFPSSNLP